MANRIILVLGCHRSGTSLIAKSLECLGVQLGHRLQPAAADNPAGFHEDLDFQTVNQSLLQGAGADWDTLGPIDVKNAAASQIVRALIEDRLHRYPLFGLKDPRLCRTLPFWRKVLPEYAEISCVYVLRNPMSVAASLEARNGMDPVKAIQLWLVNTLGALTQADPFWPRVMVDYDLMMADPDAQLRRISNALKLEFRYTTPLAQPDLRHHRHDGMREMAGSIAADLYELLARLARDEEPFTPGCLATGKFLAWATELERMTPLFRSLDAKKKPAVSGHRFGDFRWPA